jgi:hypothetical protein
VALSLPLPLPFCYSTLGFSKSNFRKPSGFGNVFESVATVSPDRENPLHQALLRLEKGIRAAPAGAARSLAE